MNNITVDNSDVIENNAPITPQKEKPLKTLPMPLLIALGGLGVLLMIIIFVSTFSSRGTPVTPTPTPPIIKQSSSPTSSPTAPTRKIATNSALQAIFDSESSASSTLNQTDFTEQKLIPPQLDMSISFDK